MNTPENQQTNKRLYYSDLLKKIQDRLRKKGLLNELVSENSSIKNDETISVIYLIKRSNLNEN